MSRNSTGDGNNGDTSARPWSWLMVRARWAIGGTILGVVGSSWIGVGQRLHEVPNAPAGAADEADGTIDGIVRKVGRGIQNASASVRERYDRAQGASRNEALLAEVNARLRQDKSLEAGRIVVLVEHEGTVILKGQVPDDKSKDLAVNLTRDIRGVVRVEDHLAIPPSTRVFAVTSDQDSTTSARPRLTR